MKFYNKDGEEVEVFTKDGGTPEIYTKQDLKDAVGEIEATYKDEAKELNETIGTLKTDLEAANEKKAPKAGSKDEQFEAVQKELNDFKAAQAEKEKASVKKAIEDKIESVTGGNNELKEMLQIQLKNNFKEISSVDDVNIIDTAFGTITSTEEGKTIMDGINDAKSKAGGVGEKDDKAPSKESMSLLGISEDDVKNFS